MFGGLLMWDLGSRVLIRLLSSVFVPGSFPSWRQHAY